MHDETEPNRCRRCGHAEFMHYSNDPGFAGSCRGTYQDGPGIKDICGCACPGYEPL